MGSNPIESTKFNIMKKKYEFEASIKREIGDFNIIKFPLEFWNCLENFQNGDKIKIIIINE